MDFDLLIFDVEGTLTDEAGELLPGRAKFFERLAESEKRYGIAFLLTPGLPLGVSAGWCWCSRLMRLGFAVSFVGQLQEAISLFFAEPGRTLFIGDENADYDAAQRAGCAFMWASDFF
jgi:phosphoglycolate phosphatase-like HAD superfamily hydrolase